MPTKVEDTGEAEEAASVHAGEVSGLKIVIETQNERKDVPNPAGFRKFHFIDVIVFVLAVATGYFDQANHQERRNRRPYEPLLWSEMEQNLFGLLDHEEVAEIYEILKQREEQTKS